eukprot:s4393_g3.t1
MQLRLDHLSPCPGAAGAACTVVSHHEQVRSLVTTEKEKMPKSMTGQHRRNWVHSLQENRCKDVPEVKKASEHKSGRGEHGNVVAIDAGDRPLRLTAPRPVFACKEGCWIATRMILDLMSFECGMPLPSSGRVEWLILCYDVCLGLTSLSRHCELLLLPSLITQLCRFLILEVPEWLLISNLRRCHSTDRAKKVIHDLGRKLSAMEGSFKDLSMRSLFLVTEEYYQAKKVMRALSWRLLAMEASFNDLNMQSLLEILEANEKRFEFEDTLDQLELALHHLQKAHDPRNDPTRDTLAGATCRISVRLATAFAEEVGCLAATWDGSEAGFVEAIAALNPFLVLER